MRRQVPGKARVHELAKELGVTSKDVLKKLADLGEYVKSASSTVEAPVARKLRDSFPSETAKTSHANGAPANGPAGGGATTGTHPTVDGAAVKPGPVPSPSRRPHPLPGSGPSIGPDIGRSSGSPAAPPRVSPSG